MNLDERLDIAKALLLTGDQDTVKQFLLVADALYGNENINMKEVREHEICTRSKTLLTSKSHFRQEVITSVIQTGSFGKIVVGNDVEGRILKTIFKTAEDARDFAYDMNGRKYFRLKLKNKDNLVEIIYCSEEELSAIYDQYIDDWTITKERLFHKDWIQYRLNHYENLYRDAVKNDCQADKQKYGAIITDMMYDIVECCYGIQALDISWELFHKDLNA